jgi:hypothetical protein
MWHKNVIRHPVGIGIAKLRHQHHHSEPALPNPDLKQPQIDENQC